jgi:hypothetical protein
LPVISGAMFSPLDEIWGRVSFSIPKLVRPCKKNEPRPRFCVLQTIPLESRKVTAASPGR